MVPTPGTKGACTNGVSATNLKTDKMISSIMTLDSNDASPLELVTSARQAKY